MSDAVLNIIPLDVRMKVNLRSFVFTLKLDRITAKAISLIQIIE